MRDGYRVRPEHECQTQRLHGQERELALHALLVLAPESPEQHRVAPQKLPLTG